MVTTRSGADAGAIRGDGEDSGTWIEITPAGVSRPRKALSRSWSELCQQLAHSVLLIRWNLRERTFGRVFGPVWIVLDPLLQSLLYFLILSYVFGIKGSDVTFLAIVASITFWRLHGNLLGAAPSIFVSRGAILQQTNFPVRLILFEFIGLELFFFLINLVIALTILIIGGVQPTVLWLLLPVLVLVQVLFTTCIVMAVGIIGVFVRDTAQIIGVVVTVWFYASPVIYSYERLPAVVRPYLEWTNPFAHLMPAYRGVLFDGELPNGLAVFVVALVSAAGLIAGLSLLGRARHYYYRFL